MNLRTDHPRVLLTPADLPTLRRRAETTHAAELKSLLALAAAPQDPGPNADHHQPLWRLAFLHLLTGEEKHAALAADHARKLLALPVSGAYFTGARRLKALATAYDWLHAALDADVRTQIGTRALEYCQALYNSGEVEPGAFFLGHAINQMPFILMAAIATSGEIPNGKQHHFIDDTLARLDKQLPCYRHFLEQDSFQQSYTYTSTYVGEFPYLFTAIEAGLGSPMYEPHKWFANLTKWWTHALRDDDTFIRFGDYFCAIPIFENPQYLRPLAAIAAQYKDGLAQHWVDRFTTQANEPDVFLFHDRPGVPPVDPNKELPRTRIFPRMGVAIARGDFATGKGPAGTVASFKCSPLYLHNHGHRDANSFTLYHAADLAIDSGAYDAYETPHWYNYYVRTIAHNTIVVHDPDEVFTSRGKQYANDGGQRFINQPHFQPTKYEDIFDPVYKDGTILAYRDGDGFSYVCGDASDCYRDDKLTRFRRHVVFVLDHPAKSHVSMLILDDLELHRPGLEPRFLLHTMNQPQVAASVITAAHNNARLTATVLLPADPKITLIGGPGREFEVDGRNYPLNRTMVGRHTPGAWRAEITDGRGAGPTRTFLTLLTPAAVDAAPAPMPTVTETPAGYTVRQGGLTIALARPGQRLAATGERVIQVDLAG